MSSSMSNLGATVDEMMDFMPPMRGFIKGPVDAKKLKSKLLTEMRTLLL